MTKSYEALAHAMQTGVAFEMVRNPKPTEPKHLRVGINAAMADHAGLVKLLIKKGVFTEQEYVDAITESMQDEVKRYERHLEETYGAKITLA
jgi:hypothetical protein